MKTSRPTGSIKGVVRNAEDALMSDVSIVIVTGPTHLDLAALTGPDGTFGFASLRPGVYAVKAHGAEAESVNVKVRVFARKTAFIEIWLDWKPADTESDVVDEM